MNEDRQHIHQDGKQLAKYHTMHNWKITDYYYVGIFVTSSKYGIILIKYRFLILEVVLTTFKTTFITK